MHNPAYLMLSRHNIYYFRWPIPKPMRDDNRSRHIVLSLGTREPQEALRLARVLEYHASLIMEECKLVLMNNSEIKAALHDYLQQTLAGRKQRILEEGPLPKEKVERLKELVKEDADFAELFEEGTEFEDPDAFGDVARAIGLDIKPGTPQYRHFYVNYFRGMAALHQELLRFNEEQKDFDFAPHPQPVIANQRIKPRKDTLEEIGQKFITMQMQDKRWDHNTEQEKLAHIATLKEIVGPQFVVNDMDAEKARYVRDTVRAIPKNRAKNPKLRNLSLTDALKVPNVPKIAPATIKKYMETYNALFAWCMDEGYTDKNNFRTLRGRGDQKKGQLKRMPFTDDQIKAIRAEVDKGRAGLANKDYRYWGTLIGMYTGARLNEIGQIMLDDIKQEDGIWYFDMNDDGDNKKLKTEASRRRVPIHNALLERGIIEYRDKLRKQGKSRLLYELSYCKKNGWGKLITPSVILVIQITSKS